MKAVLDKAEILLLAPRVSALSSAADHVLPGGTDGDQPGKAALDYLGGSE